MLPIHFRLIAEILNRSGYHVEVLDTRGRHIVETGLRYVHNDACYPAVLVIGQLLDALESGKYDKDKVALMLMQTGGGCRASNYVSLLRKALERANLSHVPVLSFNVVGLEKNPGFKLTIPLLVRMMYAVLFGDLLMTLEQRTRPYEREAGASEALAKKWTDRLVTELQKSVKIPYPRVKALYAEIVRDFAALDREPGQKIRVGIVGEIFVKFSPLGNNNLEDFLISEGAEPVMPGLLDFCMYVVSNLVFDSELYGIHRAQGAMWRVAYRFLLKKQRDLIAAIRENSDFLPPTDFEHTRSLVEGYMHVGAKMGEGWLLTAEMLELIDSGTKNVICTQPFGCLPNHIVGKGVMKHIRETHPEANLVAIDYDPSATAINQENRIKLMLANAAKQENLPIA